MKDENELWRDMNKLSPQAREEFLKELDDTHRWFMKRFPRKRITPEEKIDWNKEFKIMAKEIKNK